MNKKGVVELFLIVGLVFACTFIAFVASYIYQQIHAKLEGKVSDNALANLEATLNAIKIQNWLIPFIFMGSIVGIIIASFYIKTHPIFFVASLIIFVFAVIFSGTISNAFDGVMNNSMLQQFQGDYFAETTYFMNNLPTFVTIGGIIICIVLYSRARQEMG